MLFGVVLSQTTTRGNVDITMQVQLAKTTVTAGNILVLNLPVSGFRVSLTLVSTLTCSLIRMDDPTNSNYGPIACTVIKGSRIVMVIPTTDTNNGADKMYAVKF
jgi:hypothetical protein